MRFPIFLVALVVAFPAAQADDPKPAKPAPRLGAATPPPKKKRAELEADEEPAVIVIRDQQSSKAESYPVALPLIGTWEVAGKRLAIKNDGTYTLTGAETGSGYVHANLGLLRRKSTGSAQWIAGRYTFRDIHTVEIEGIFPAGEWKRVR